MSPASPTLGGAIDGWLTRGSTIRLGIGRLEDRLLLMPGALAQHAVEPQADEQCHQGEDDDDGQSFDPILANSRRNIMRDNAQIQRALQSSTRQSPLRRNLRDC